MTTLNEQKATIEAAEKKLGESRKALFNRDGRRIYSDAEHAEREAAANREFREALARASSAAGETLREAEAVLSEGPDDPIHELTASELQRANQLREFVREYAENLSLRELVDRVESALRSGAKPECYLWHRYLQRRFDALPRAWHGMVQVPTDPADSKAFTTLSNLLERLADRLTDPVKKARREQERAAAEAKQSEAVGVIGGVALSKFMEQNYGRRGR